jgi:hypothetical protein
MLALPLDKLAFIIGIAKAIDGEIPGSQSLTEDWEAEPDPWQQPALSCDELQGLIDTLPQDELADLLALVWLGRGDVPSSGWRAARTDARRVLSRSEWRYLMGTSMLGDFLEEGAEALGLSVEETVVALH